MPATDQAFFVTARKLKFRRGRRKVLDLILCKIVKMTTRGLKLPKIKANAVVFTKHSSKSEIHGQLSY